MPNQATDDTTPRHILVVDDDSGVRLSLIIALESDVLEIDEAPDGLSALDLIRTKPFDALLIDVQMPGMTGLELAASVRERNTTLPIALMTGAPTTVPTEARQAMGIDQLFIKPFDLNDVTAWLHTALALTA